MAPSLQSILSSPSSPMVRVEKATSSLLTAPNWTMNTDIINSVNSNPWKAKGFVKAVKKRMQNKNSKVHFLALTLLEMMMKSCGDLVHFQVAEIGILQEMVKIVRKTRHMQVREKILLLLESWQEIFGGPNGKYPQYYYTYAELKRSGVRFPHNQPQVGYGMPSNSIEILDEVMSTDSFSDLAKIQSVMDLLSNMLQAVNPNDYKAIKDEVITDLANQCRINQKKLMQLINTTDNDTLLGEALKMNDNLQNLISNYDALTTPSLSPPTLPPTTKQEEEEEEEEEDDDEFTYLANRNPVLKSNGNQEISPNKDGTNTVVSVTSFPESSSSMETNALIEFDPPAPADFSKNEGDMVDLLSLALSKDQSPQTDPALPPSGTGSLPPPPPPAQSDHNQNPFSNFPIWDGYRNDPQLLTSNEGYATYDSYIAPWARPDVAQQLPQYPTDYLPTPWISPETSSNPFLSTQTQYSESKSGVAIVSSAVTVTTTEGSRSFQNLNSFGSKGAHLNGSLRLREPASVSKAYMPDNLFEDLIKLRNSDGSLKSRNASSLWGFSGQGMASVK